MIPGRPHLGDAGGGPPRAGVPPPLVLVLLTALGGVAGAGARWAVFAAAPEGQAVTTTLAVNVAGSALVGVALGWGLDRAQRWWALLGPGFAGGLTTFSTVAVLVAVRLRAGEVGAAAGALGVLVLPTLLAAGLAVAVAGRGRR